MIGQSVVTWGRMPQRLSMLIILISGIYLVADRWEFSDFFASWGMAAIIALFALSEAYFILTTSCPSRRPRRYTEAQAIAGQQGPWGQSPG